MGVNRRSATEPRRTYYPSGPWIDGIRPTTVDDVTPDKTSERKQAKPKRPAGNPDPNNYQILKAEEKGSWLVVLIQYPDCTNYEGRKILVFEDLTLLQLVNQKAIDPHFFKDGKFKSPIARFVPTDEGWSMAVHFAQMLSEAKETKT